MTSNTWYGILNWLMAGESEAPKPPIDTSVQTGTQAVEDHHGNLVDKLRSYLPKIKPTFHRLDREQVKQNKPQEDASQA